MKKISLNFHKNQDWQEALDFSFSHLQEGKILLLPTETVYGLAVDAFSPSALDSLFALKGREKNKAFTLHIPSLNFLSSLVKIDKSLEKSLLDVAKNFLPGPLTLVLPKNPSLPSALCGNSPFVGLRMSSHPFLKKLSEKFQKPLALSSANFSSFPSPKSFNQVSKELKKKLDLGIDSGSCPLGFESTVVHLEKKNQDLHLNILRKGYISAEELAEFGLVCDLTN